MNKIRLLIIALILLLVFSACGNTKPTVSNSDSAGPESSQNSGSTENSTNIPPLSTNKPKDIKLIKKTAKANYLISNGIKVMHKNVKISTSKGDIAVWIDEISGLTDKSLETKLNNSIEQDVKNAVIEYAAESEEKPMELYCVTELNSNNLISISLRDYYSDPMFGILYSLTDGKRVYLKDIFTQESDYVGLLNQNVVEGILGRGVSEELILREPFSTVDSNQNFSLSQSILYMIFKKGESGFDHRTSISIPLWKIDDYVDIIDRYSKSSMKAHSFKELMETRNNIFIEQKGEIIKRKNGAMWVYYPQIHSMSNPSFQQEINTRIKNSISEVLKDEALDNIAKLPDSSERDPLETIYMTISFNHYGLLCMKRYTNNFAQSESLAKYNTNYAFDLANSKELDLSGLILNFSMKHPEFTNNFLNVLKQNLSTICVNQNINITSEEQSKIDFDFITQNSLMTFRKYGPEDPIAIEIAFNSNAFANVSRTVMCEVSLKDIIKTSYEDFFGH